ncbi:haloacid dehalogenase type II [Saccharopolyspora sp. NFXS83]|uniref:haloacid dehalogenase type II n=1 Tax=Saccharopolyspora sp. NFXS83 TaxID=2993560 RepID=UPI00224AF37E|nr:haloacid dehalogenase type II [Saccharopolyspora sp. NFXS83]MCX2730653.1 haloacid dehalogenase type II [Saccharopolyspora sp. NFXS83]
MLDEVRVVAFDVFGTAVDWHTGITTEVGEVFAHRGVELDPTAFADSWRERYLPSMARVNNGEREWAYLDALHRESLDALLAEHEVADAVGESDRARLVRAWHRLPAWPDSDELLTRLRRRYTVVALSNGGFGLLVDLVKAAGLPFDAIVSAELARSYKPAPAPYLTTARLLDVAPGEVLLVAAHGWDLDGARAAGLRTAFLERPAEKGPHREADRAADTTCDLAATSASELAARLGC